MSAQPKTALEKTAQYDNDSFNVWLQKTNIVAREEGDLNLLEPSLLGMLVSQLTGTASVTMQFPQKVVGTNTLFTQELVVGNVIKFSSGVERYVVSIQSDTELTLDTSMSAAVTDSELHNMSAFNLVSAINITYQFATKELRNLLIKSIAMS